MTYEIRRAITTGHTTFDLAPILETAGWRIKPLPDGPFGFVDAAGS